MKRKLNNLNNVLSDIDAVEYSLKTLNADPISHYIAMLTLQALLVELKWKRDKLLGGVMHT